MRTRARAVWTIAGCALYADAAQAADPVPLPPVEVSTVRVVPGLELPAEQIPANVQTLDAKALGEGQSVNLPEAMLRRLPSVHVNEVQGNPYQVDVNFRGFTASPRLGLPQGLSVYVDGVRVNEPFGDIVNWDTLPLVAIDSLVLMPGSHPLYGLNTLGGALVLHTKRGDTSPGTSTLVSAGAFGRRRAEIEHGAGTRDLHGYVSGAFLGEDGWRDHSDSHVRNAFGKIGARHGALDWTLALSHARNTLTGNGLLPEPMLAQRREEIYTRPDITRNRVTQGTLTANVERNDTRVTAVVYHRHARTGTLNGDLSDEFSLPPDPTSVENRTHTRQRSTGGTLQVHREWTRMQVTAGVAYDYSRSRFEQTEAEGVFDPTRAVVATEALETDVLVRGRTRAAGLYATGTLALRPGLHVSAGLRYNAANVRTMDELNPPGGPNLNADYDYSKLNPAAGVTWEAAPALTLFAGFSQGNRVPSPIELGCADPATPCTLPNALQSDPYLKQVVARTFEIGARGRFDGGYRWSAAAFRTGSDDDILFVGTTASATRGFFQNFGRTRRQGIELALGRAAPRLDWQASYSLIDATFESSACVVSPHNSSAGLSPACAPQQIEVLPGNEIPGMPRHIGKANVVVRPAAGWTLGVDASAFSRQYVRGNENNAHQPDGVTFMGSGRTKGYALVDVHASYKVARSVEVIAKVTNLFDKSYETAGQLGRSAFDAAGNFIPDASAWRNAQFVGPGAPRAGWVGVRYRLDPRAPVR